MPLPRMELSRRLLKSKNLEQEIMIMDFMDDFIMFESVFPSIIDVTCSACGNTFQVEVEIEDNVRCVCPNCSCVIDVEI